MADHSSTRVFVSHEVMFLLPNGEGDVVPTDNGYGRVTHVTVCFPAERDPQVSGSVRRCKKDGTDDARFKGGNVCTMARLSAEDKNYWITRAKQELG